MPASARGGRWSSTWPKPRGTSRRPMPYVPCPQRGEHRRLVDCWLCWSDVMRGVILEPQAIRSDAWLDLDEEAALWSDTEDEDSGPV